MGELVLTENYGRVATLTLNRPARHNSFVPELLKELLDALEEVGRRPGVGALTLEANGRSFSTGGDVKAFNDHRESLAAYADVIVGLLNRVILSLVSHPVPVVAAVHGKVAGGSLGFVLASDIVLISPEASLTPVYAEVGFSPDGGWTAMLPAVIGPSRAAEVQMLNRPIRAEEAVEWGIASRLVPASEIRQEARALAASIAEKKPGSIRRTKRLLWGDVNALAVRLEQEKKSFREQIVSPEALEGMRAFLERRG